MQTSSPTTNHFIGPHLCGAVLQQLHLRGCASRRRLLFSAMEPSGDGSKEEDGGLTESNGCFKMLFNPAEKVGGGGMAPLGPSSNREGPRGPNGGGPRRVTPPRLTGGSPGKGPPPGGPKRGGGGTPPREGILLLFPGGNCGNDRLATPGNLGISLSLIESGI